MNIQAIRLFLHVMQRGSLAAGAQQLNMSASAASRLLSGLERTTGLKLFSRDGHALRPTTEGAQYFNECHRVLVAVDELPRAAKRLASGGQSAALKSVGSGPRLASSLMIPTIGRFAKRNPDAQIDFKVLQPHEFPRMTDRLDIAVGAMLPQSITSVEGSPLFDMPTVAVMRNDHPLASRSSVRAADLAAHKLIATATGPMREELEHMFHAEGVEFRPQYTASSYEHAGALLLQIGAVLITDPLVPLAIDPGSFALVPLKPLRMVQTSIFTPILAPESRLIAEFKTCLREEGAALEKRVASFLSNSGAARIRTSTRSHKDPQRRQAGAKPKPGNRSAAKSASGEMQAPSNVRFLVKKRSFIPVSPMSLLTQSGYPKVVKMTTTYRTVAPARSSRPVIRCKARNLAAIANCVIIRRGARLNVRTCYRPTFHHSGAGDVAYSGERDGTRLVSSRVRFSGLHALWMANALICLLIYWLTIGELAAVKRWTGFEIILQFLPAIVQYFACSLISIRREGGEPMKGLPRKARPLSSQPSPS